MKYPIFFIFIILTIQGCAPSTTQEYRNEISLWQQNRLERLKSETGWLNLAGLYWLKEGENSFGADSSNSIIFPLNAPEFCGNIYKEGDKLIFNVHPGTEIFHKDSLIDQIELLSDQTGNPTVCSTVNLSWHIIKRGNQYGIRLRDYKHPRIEALSHIPVYETDAKWRKKAEYTAFDRPDTLEVATMIGGKEKYIVPGKLSFTHKGKKYELFPFRTSSGTFFIIIGDLTSAVETYAAGRYLYTEAPEPDNTVILDFNKAYNPPCAFSPFATCPLPPPENRLNLSVRAGEKSVHPD